MVAQLRQDNVSQVAKVDLWMVVGTPDLPVVQVEDRRSVYIERSVMRAAKVSKIPIHRYLQAQEHLLGHRETVPVQARHEGDPELTTEATKTTWQGLWQEERLALQTFSLRINLCRAHQPDLHPFLSLLGALPQWQEDCGVTASPFKAVTSNSSNFSLFRQTILRISVLQDLHQLLHIPLIKHLLLHKPHPLGLLQRVQARKDFRARVDHPQHASDLLIKPTYPTQPSCLLPLV